MLNDTKIKQLKPKDKPYRVADQGGLCIEVRISGLKFWRFRYRFLGSAKMVTLGEYPIVTLAAERQKERHNRKLEQGFKKRAFYINEASLAVLEDFKNKKNLESLDEALNKILESK